jgi:hypothetical protein
LESGRTLTVKSVESAEEFGRQSNEKYTIEVKQANIIYGSKETVRRKLLEIQKSCGVEEFIVVMALKSHEKRVRAYELLKEAFTEQPV